MLLIEINNLRKYYMDRLILDIGNLKIYSEDKIGIVGVNGAGKSTLLNLLTGKIYPDEGTVKLTGSYSYITQFDGADLDNIDEQIAGQFNISAQYRDSMSGGEKTRLKIAQSLSKQSSIMFADEPTSNLDVSGIALLEEKLLKYKGPLLLISHDRALLDRLCNKILEIENGKIKIYNGNYSEYKQQKDAEFERQLFEYEQYVGEKRKLEAAIEFKKEETRTMRKAPSRMGNSEARLHKMGNQKAKASLDGAAKSYESRIEKLDVKDKPIGLARAKVDIQSREELFSKIILQGKNISKSFGSCCLYDNARFEIYNGWKTAIIGDNGTGKTTLIKMIVSGHPCIKVSEAVKIGYFSQDMNILNDDLNIIDNVMKDSIHSETFARILLARLLFKKEDVYKKVSVLSGGEKIKVSFAKIFLSDINMLILDEPTNYLDVCSAQAVENALKEYNGTLVFVSHDRKFINEVADHIIVVEDKKFKTFEGDYDEYLRKRNQSIISDLEDIKNKKMVLENRLSEVISKLSMPTKKDDVRALDNEYKRIIDELKGLKALLS